MTWSWSRLNTVLLLAVLLVLIAMFATRASGGPLDPPGPPGSTDGVQSPGTPITSLPFAITQSGHYYVTRPLTGVMNQNGITISASNVTLDLGGFNLAGVSQTGNGVAVINGVRNVTVENGSVRGWSVGVNASTATQATISGITAMSNANHGVMISVHSELRDCNSSLNLYGVQVEKGIVRNCRFTENENAGLVATSNSLIEGNYFHANVNAGVALNGGLNTVRDNDFSENSTHLRIVAGANSNVVMFNALCIVENNGENTQFVDNAQRFGPC